MEIFYHSSLPLLAASILFLWKNASAQSRIFQYQYPTADDWTSTNVLFSGAIQIGDNVFVTATGETAFVQKLDLGGRTPVAGITSSLELARGNHPETGAPQPYSEDAFMAFTYDARHGIRALVIDAETLVPRFNISLGHNIFSQVQRIPSTDNLLVSISSWAVDNDSDESLALIGPDGTKLWFKYSFDLPLVGKPVVSPDGQEIYAVSSTASAPSGSATIYRLSTRDGSLLGASPILSPHSNDAELTLSPTNGFLYLPTIDCNNTDDSGCKKYVTRIDPEFLAAPVLATTTTTERDGTTATTPNTAGIVNLVVPQEVRENWIIPQLMASPADGQILFYHGSGYVGALQVDEYDGVSITALWQANDSEIVHYPGPFVTPDGSQLIHLASGTSDGASDYHSAVVFRDAKTGAIQAAARKGIPRFMIKQMFVGGEEGSGRIYVTTSDKVVAVTNPNANIQVVVDNNNGDDDDTSLPNESGASLGALSSSTSGLLLSSLVVASTLVALCLVQ